MLLELFLLEMRLVVILSSFNCFKYLSKRFDVFVYSFHVSMFIGDDKGRVLFVEVM